MTRKTAAILPGFMRNVHDKDRTGGSESENVPEMPEEYFFLANGPGPVKIKDQRGEFYA
jgi:hypothetical protein